MTLSTDLIVGEASIVDDVIDFAVFSVNPGKPEISSMLPQVLT